MNNKSDYAIVLEELNFYKKFINKKELDKIMVQKNLAEKTLNIVLDLINSNEELAHFPRTKFKITQPITEYFRKAK